MGNLVAGPYRNEAATIETIKRSLFLFQSKV
jgi:hypothetical protein